MSETMRVNSFDSRDVTAWETVSRKLAKFGRRSRGPLSAALNEPTGLEPTCLSRSCNCRGLNGSVAARLQT